MTIVDKIKQLCESVTGLPVLYDSKGGLNVLLDNADYPCVYCTLLETTSVTNENGNIVEGVRVALVVCNKTEFDVGSIENESIIADCKAVANNILRNIRLTGALVLDSINEAQRFYEQYDVLLTGYALNLNVSEIYGDTGCDIEPITITINENGEYDVTGVQKAVVNIPILQKAKPSTVNFDGASIFVAGYPAGQFMVTTIDELDEIIHIRSIDFSTVQSISLRGFNYYYLREVAPNAPYDLDLTGLGINALTSLPTGGLTLSMQPKSGMTAETGCGTVDLHDWDTSKVTNAYDFIATDYNLRDPYWWIYVDMRGWSAESVTSGTMTFYGGGAGRTCVGKGMTKQQVIDENIVVYKGLKRPATFARAGVLDGASMRAIFQGLADLTALGTTQSINMGVFASRLLAELTDEDIAVATNKGWTFIGI